jgi:hypothetical protein
MSTLFRNMADRLVGYFVPSVDASACSISPGFSYAVCPCQHCPVWDANGKVHFAGCDVDPGGTVRCYKN